MLTTSVDNNRSANSNIGTRSTQPSNGRQQQAEDSKVALFEALLSIPLFQSNIEPAPTKAEPKTKSDSSEKPNKAEEDESRNEQDTTPISNAQQVVVPFPVEQPTPVVAKKTAGIETNGPSTKSNTVKAASGQEQVIAKSDQPKNVPQNTNQDSEPTPVQPVKAVRSNDTSVASQSAHATSTETAPSTELDTPQLTEKKDTKSGGTIAQTNSIGSQSKVKETPSTKANDKEHKPDKQKFDQQATQTSAFEFDTEQQPTLSNIPTEAKIQPDQSISQNTNQHDDNSQRGRRSERLENNRRENRFEAKEIGSSSTTADSTEVTSTNSDPSHGDAKQGLEQGNGFQSTLTSSFDVSNSLDVNSFESSLNQITVTATPPTDSVASKLIASSQTVAGSVNVAVNNPAGESLNGVAGITSASTTRATSGTSSPTAASAGSRPPLTEHQTQRLMNRVVSGMEQLKDGTNQVRLRLHPPELGSLQVTIRVENQNMSAMIEAEHTAARDALIENLPQLQKSLSDQGIQVAKFDVQVVDPSQFSNSSSFGNTSGFSSQQGSNQDGSQASRHSRYADMNRNRIDNESKAEALSPRLWTRNAGNIDLTA